MAKEKLLQCGDTPIDFYSWGNTSDSGIISRNEQIQDELEGAFDSIEIEEDKATPEVDYVLRVLGKEAGRIVIPFDTIVKDAYYDVNTKEIVLVVTVGETETKEIRFSVKDLIDTYIGDELTIHVEKNVISITQQVMDKFSDLEGDIIDEKIYREQGDKALDERITTEINDRDEADTALTQEIEKVREESKTQAIPLDKIRQLFQE